MTLDIPHDVWGSALANLTKYFVWKNPTTTGTFNVSFPSHSLHSFAVDAKKFCRLSKIDGGFNGFDNLFVGVSAVSSGHVSIVSQMDTCVKLTVRLFQSPFLSVLGAAIVRPWSANQQDGFVFAIFLVVTFVELRGVPT